MKPPFWNRLLATGMRFAPSRRRQLTAVLVDQGRHAGHQLGMMFGELVEITRQRTGELRRIVRLGADRQLNGLGLVTKRDLVAFERQMLPTPAVKTAPAKKKVTTNRDGARKSGAASTLKRAH